MAPITALGGCFLADGGSSPLLPLRASSAALGREVTEGQLRELVSEETIAWAERWPADIVAELAKPQTYRRGTGDTWHEIELTLLEATDDYTHVKTAYMTAASCGLSSQ